MKTEEIINQIIYKTKQYQEKPLDYDKIDKFCKERNYNADVPRIIKQNLSQELIDLSKLSLTIQKSKFDKDVLMEMRGHFHKFLADRKLKQKYNCTLNAMPMKKTEKVSEKVRKERTSILKDVLEARYNIKIGDEDNCNRLYTDTLATISSKFQDIINLQNLLSYLNEYIFLCFYDEKDEYC